MSSQRPCPRPYWRHTPGQLSGDGFRQACRHDEGDLVLVEVLRAGPFVKEFRGGGKQRQSKTLRVEQAGSLYFF